MRGPLVRAALDPPRRELAELAAHRAVARGGARDVVLGPPELEVAVPRRPGGAHVAVERHADAAGVDEIGAVGARPTELEMAVAEDDRALPDAGQQPLVVFGGLGR